MKRKKFHATTIDMNDSSKESVTYFENLSNEIIYEIFEFLDFYYIHEIFSNLNQRFQNLITDSKLSIKINISSISKSNFQHYYTDIIAPNKHRIKSLCIEPLFIANIILSSLDNISKLTRLETLILNNVKPSYLTKLKYLNILSRLFSLVIISNDYVHDQTEVYHQIFHLPVLRYCNVTLGEGYIPGEFSLPFATNKYSPIEHLVINNNIYRDVFDVILSYVPQLCRLKIPMLFEPVPQRRWNSFLIELKYLTHISFTLGVIIIDNLELLVKELFHNLQVLRINTSYDITYLDADLWQHLILSYMPNLKIFDFQYYRSVGSAKRQPTSTYETRINKFNSSFWIERQWFFAIQYPSERYRNVTFYSTKPYRRKYFTIQGKPEDKNNFDSVRCLQIDSTQTMINCMNYFPNATKLTFHGHIGTFGDSIKNSLTRIVPVKQITKLAIHYNSFSFMHMIQILNLMVNIRELTLASLPLNEINSATIQENVTFQLVSMTNVVKNVILEEEYSLERIELLIALCPRLQHLTLNEINHSLLSIIRLLLSKNNANNRHLSSLCLLKVNNAVKEKVKMVIEKEKLLDDFSIKYINHKLYLWW